MVRSFIAVFLPQKKNKDLVDIVYRKRHLSRGPKIAVVGGGTGLSVLLRGIKEYTSNITAIVTVTDEGGSSGRLREKFNTLPPGDIRNCLVALADAEPLMSDLFQFRFKESSEFQGHNFGNLFIMAMSKLTGDFQQAIEASSKVLAIRGKVVPSTLERVRLVAEHDNGAKTEGEIKISESKNPIRKLYLNPKVCQPTEETLSALKEAEVIILGPGSLYTSIIPNLLIEGVSKVIFSSDAVKIYISNVMTQSGETDNYKASDHVRAILNHTIPGIVDYVIVNTGKVPSELLGKYEEEKAYPVVPDTETVEDLGIKVIASEVISTTDYVRHDSDKLARLLMDLIQASKVTL